MTSLVTHDFPPDISQGTRIPDDVLAYMGASLCNLLHQVILVEFGKAEQSSGLTKAKLARRIGKKPEQVTRWLSYPGNLTLETVGIILSGMGLRIESLGLSNFVNGMHLEFPEFEEHPTQDQDPLLIETPGQSAGLYWIWNANKQLGISPRQNLGGSQPLFKGKNYVQRTGT